ncbi:MAG: hypothetical protein R3F43_00260 [bacterium]
MRPSGRWAAPSGWLALLGLLTFNGLFFGSAAQALYHVSPVLKCEWSMVPGTFDASSTAAFSRRPCTSPWKWRSTTRHGGR